MVVSRHLRSRTYNDTCPFHTCTMWGAARYCTYLAFTCDAPWTAGCFWRETSYFLTFEPETSGSVGADTPALERLINAARAGNRGQLFHNRAKFQRLWLLAQFFFFFFTFNVGTLIITLSYAEVDLLTRFSVMRHFFCTFVEEKCQILFWANLFHTYVGCFTFCYVYRVYY